MKYNEDTLVQETTANYLRDQLGWDSVYAYNEEKFGPEGTLGRKDETEVVLRRYLGEALVRIESRFAPRGVSGRDPGDNAADHLAIPPPCQS